MSGRAFALPFAGLLLAAVAIRFLPAERPTSSVPPPAVAPDAPPAAAPPAPPPPVVAPPPSTSHVYVEPVLSAKEILPLLEARFSDETILAVARVSGRAFKASAEEIDVLRRAGMSDTLLGRLRGEPEPAPAPPPAAPPVVVYAPVTVTVVNEAPPPPPPASAEPEVVVTGGVFTCAHGRAGCCPPVVIPPPPIYQKEPFFKTREFLPTKPLPTAEEVERRDKARSSRIHR